MELAMDSQKKNEQTDLITLARLYKNESSSGTKYLSGNLGAFSKVLVFYDRDPKGDAIGWLKLATRPPKEEGGQQQGEKNQVNDSIPF